MLNFPSQNDQLFFKSSKSSDIILESGIRKFFLFSESYKTAAGKLFVEIRKKDYDMHLIIAPTIFICRHFIELRLKELISGINYTKSEEYSFPDGHNLENLWNTYQTTLSTADKSIIPNRNHILAITKLIKEFSLVDLSSMSFRYPVNKDKKTESLANLGTFDMDNFMNIMEKIFDFFHEQSGNVFNLIQLADSYFIYLHSQMEQQYY